MDQSKLSYSNTDAIRTQNVRTQYREHSSPLFLTSSFTFETAEEMAATFAGERAGIIYSRYSNPNTDELIQKVCSMEGAEAGFATASGMAAVFASIAAFVQRGDHVLASRALFGSTHQILTNILTKWGVTHTFVEPGQEEQWGQHVRPETKMLVVETPSNPGLTLVDLNKAARVAREHQLILNVDNCFATPYVSQPLRLGAQLVTHSGTKWMDGQGRVLGGLIVGDQALLDQVVYFCRHTGPAMSPFNAYTLSKSLETLGVRMERHCANALELAQRLEAHPETERVLYPCLKSHPQTELARRQMRLGGGLVSFVVRGGRERAMRLLNQLQVVSLSANLGDTRTIVTHPSSTTHHRLTEEERQSVGITQGMIRMSVGLEDVDDIWRDLEKAL